MKILSALTACFFFLMIFFVYLPEANAALNQENRAIVAQGCPDIGPPPTRNLPYVAPTEWFWKPGSYLEWKFISGEFLSEKQHHETVGWAILGISYDGHSLLIKEFRWPENKFYCIWKSVENGVSVNSSVGGTGNVIPPRILPLTLDGEPYAFPFTGNFVQMTGGEMGKVTEDGITFKNLGRTTNAGGKGYFNTTPEGDSSWRGGYIGTVYLRQTSDSNSIEFSKNTGVWRVSSWWHPYGLDSTFLQRIYLSDIELGLQIPVAPYSYEKFEELRNYYNQINDDDDNYFLMLQTLDDMLEIDPFDEDAIRIKNNLKEKFEMGSDSRNEESSSGGSNSAVVDDKELAEILQALEDEQNRREQWEREQAEKEKEKNTIKPDCPEGLRAAFNEPEGWSCIPITTRDSGGCLIATAAFGSELAPQVQLLREIRDNTVMNTYSGAAFMTTFNEIYYSFSPAIADMQRENPVFQEAVRLFITPMISTLSIMTLADQGSEAEVLGLGISVIALNLGIYFAAPAVLGIKVHSHLKSKRLE